MATKPREGGSELFYWVDEHGKKQDELHETWTACSRAAPDTAGPAQGLDRRWAGPAPAVRRRARSTSLEKILHTQSPRHLFLCGAEGGLISADGPSQENRHRNDNSGVTATDVLELRILQVADIGGILCVVHFSLHACARNGPFRHRHEDFWRTALSGAVIAVTGWSIYDRARRRSPGRWCVIFRAPPNGPPRGAAASASLLVLQRYRGVPHSLEGRDRERRCLRVLLPHQCRVRPRGQVLERLPHRPRGCAVYQDRPVMKCVGSR